MFYSISERDELKKEHSEHFENWYHDQKNFSAIPNELIFSDKISDGERVFYFKLISLSDKKEGTLLHSNETLSKMFGCSVSNVKKYLDSLKKKKLILTLSTGPNSIRIICVCPWVSLTERIN